MGASLEVLLQKKKKQASKQASKQACGWVALDGRGRRRQASVGTGQINRLATDLIINVTKVFSHGVSVMDP